jgi:hypothetical protein
MQLYTFQMAEGKGSQQTNSILMVLLRERPSDWTLQRPLTTRQHNEIKREQFVTVRIRFLGFKLVSCINYRLLRNYYFYFTLLLVTCHVPAYNSNRPCSVHRLLQKDTLSCLRTLLKLPERSYHLMINIY